MEIEDVKTVLEVHGKHVEQIEKERAGAPLEEILRRARRRTVSTLCKLGFTEKRKRTDHAA